MDVLKTTWRLSHLVVGHAVLDQDVIDERHHRPWRPPRKGQAPDGAGAGAAQYSRTQNAQVQCNTFSMCDTDKTYSVTGFESASYE